MSSKEVEALRKSVHALEIRLVKLEQTFKVVGGLVVFVDLAIKVFALWRH